MLSPLVGAPRPAARGHRPPLVSETLRTLEDRPEPLVFLEGGPGLLPPARLHRRRRSWASPRRRCGSRRPRSRWPRCRGYDEAVRRAGLPRRVLAPRLRRSATRAVTRGPLVLCPWETSTCPRRWPSPAGASACSAATSSASSPGRTPASRTTATVDSYDDGYEPAVPVRRRRRRPGGRDRGRRAVRDLATTQGTPTSPQEGDEFRFVTVSTAGAEPVDRRASDRRPSSTATWCREAAPRAVDSPRA